MFAARKARRSPNRATNQKESSDEYHSQSPAAPEAQVAHPQEGYRHCRASAPLRPLQRQAHLCPGHRRREGATLVAVSTLTPDLRTQKLAANDSSAKTLAGTFAAKATAAGLNTFVFDRNGRRFHGKVKTFAEAVREAGLKF